MRIRTPSVRRGLDEPGCCDRLPGRRRVTEPVPANGSGIVRDGLGERLLVRLGREGDRDLVLVLLVGRDLLEHRPVAVPVAVLADLLGGGDQLGEHAGERVDLVPAQLGAGEKSWRALREDALEAEHERIPNLPARRGRGAAGAHLGERVVERAAAGRPRRENGRGVLVRAQERLLGPGFGTESLGHDRVGRLRRSRMRRCLLHGCGTDRAPPRKGRFRGEPLDAEGAHRIAPAADLR